MKKWGILLVNLGTPDDTSVGAVRRYLREFLMDPRVIDIPKLWRWLLVHLIIAPFRGPKSAKAYKKIWTDRGSPLLFHGQDLAEKLRFYLQGEVVVEFAMRYQNPSVASAMGRLRQNGVDQIIVFPLFPQYSSAAGGSAVGQIYELAAKEWNIPSFHVVPPYYDHPAFIKALAAVSKPLIEDFKPDHILFSYHGLPERHILKSEEGAGGHCLSSEDCCARIQSSNRFCYRAHCMATTRALVQELALPSTESSFQSRLGKNPWVKPYTDEVIPKLAKSGIKRLAVLCPAFTADCLETIEEVGMEARKSFLEHGGDDFLLIPCLNSADAWVEAVAEIAFSPVD